MLRFLLLSVLIGLAGGYAAGQWQISILRFGHIAADQAGAFWGSFLGAGVAVALAGGTLAGGLAALAGRRSVLAAGFGSAAAVAAAAAVFVPDNARPLPHVFLLVTDTTRADHLSLYGYERGTTPFLEEMAAESVVFDNGMSQGSHTIVSTPCILGSLYPSDHGLIDYISVLWDGHLLLSEVLRFAGYSTLGIVTNPHLSAKNGFDQGYDVYEMIGSGTSAAVYAERVNRRALEVIDEFAEKKAERERAASGAPEPDGPESDAAGAGGAPAPAERDPVFAFLFYTDPHGPYQTPTEEYQKLYDPDWEEKPLYSWNTKAHGDIDARSLFNLIAQYDATIRYWDDQLREFMAALEERGMRENSVFVYTSDHGEEFWEHGEVGHGYALFEESVNVPYMMSVPPPVKWPELSRTSRRVEEVVSGVDIMPTILEYLRVETDHEMRGRSALPLLLGRPDTGGERVAMLEQILTKYGTFDVRALRARDRKLIIVRDWQTTFRKAWDVGDMFFDLTEDPGEQVNLLHERPGEVQQYQAQLLAWIEQAERRAVKAETTELDEAHMEQLRALGYVD